MPGEREARMAETARARGVPVSDEECVMLDKEEHHG